MTWQQALKTFCDLYSESGLTNKWMVVGSVGSVLQQANMTPNDLDIYVKDVEDVRQLAEMMQSYHLRTKSDLSYYDPEWFSSDEEPFFTQSFGSGFTWTKGKWKIANFPVEIVQISNSAGIPDSDTGDGIWEGGTYIWELAKAVAFDNHRIPVVPLEIQLESNLRRNRPDRVDAIIDALATHGCDKALLNRALSSANRERYQEMLGRR